MQDILIAILPMCMGSLVVMLLGSKLSSLEMTLGDTSGIWEMSGHQCIRDGNLALPHIIKS